MAASCEQTKIVEGADTIVCQGSLRKERGFHRFRGATVNGGSQLFLFNASMRLTG